MAIPTELGDSNLPAADPPLALYVAIARFLRRTTCLTRRG